MTVLQDKTIKCADCGQEFLFTVGEQEYLDFTRRASNEMSRLQLELILADGSAYPHKGKFMFADRQVNQQAVPALARLDDPSGVTPFEQARARVQP